MTMYDAYLVGYYGMRNSGDDALLAATAWGTRYFLGARNLAISTPAPLKLHNIPASEAPLVEKQSFPGQNRFFHYKTAINARRIIFGGGSVLHTAQDINIKRHMMMLSGNEKHLALGVGIGPFADTRAERACRRFLKDCDFVGVRDEESLEIARSIAPDTDVKLTFDLAPLMLKTPGFELAPLPRKGIAVCLCPKERLHGSALHEQPRLRALAQALTKVWRDTGEPVTLLDFNGHEALGDHQVHSDLRRLLPVDMPVSVIGYDANPYRVLQRLAGFRCVISMRLHGAILGYLAQTPVLSLNYHSKCDGWCRQVGMSPLHTFDATSLDADELTMTLLSGLDDGFATNKLTVSAAVDAALENWRHDHVKQSTSLYRRYSTV